MVSSGLNRLVLVLFCHFSSVYDIYGHVRAAVGHRVCRASSPSWLVATRTIWDHGSGATMKRVGLMLIYHRYVLGVFHCWERMDLYWFVF